MAKDKKAPSEVVGEETKVEQVAPNAETTEAPAAETKPEETPAEEAPAEETKAETETPKEEVAITEEKTETDTTELNAEIPATEEVVQPSAEQPADPTAGLEFERYWDIMSHSYKQRLVKK